MLAFSGDSAALFVYPAVLKACSEGTDMACIQVESCFHQDKQLALPLTSIDMCFNISLLAVTWGVAVPLVLCHLFFVVPKFAPDFPLP